jgi:hypothetical protein
VALVRAKEAAGDAETREVLELLELEPAVFARWAFNAAFLAAVFAASALFLLRCVGAIFIEVPHPAPREVRSSSSSAGHQCMMMSIVALAWNLEMPESRFGTAGKVVGPLIICA